MKKTIIFLVIISVILACAVVTLSAFLLTINSDSKQSNVMSDTDTTKANAELDGETTLAECEEMFDYAMTEFKDRNFQWAVRVLSTVSSDVAKSESTDERAELLINKAKLYRSISMLQFDNCEFEVADLKSCNDYFDELAKGEHDQISTRDLNCLRIYTKLSLAHADTYMKEYDSSKRLLDEIDALMMNVKDKKLAMFTAYEKTYLNYDNVEILVPFLEDNDEVLTEEEASLYSYYKPLMKVMAARAYIKTDVSKAQMIIENDLMDQGSDFGRSAEEKMRILAETYTVYAEYLEAQNNAENSKDILTFRRKAASLYDSLVDTYFDRITYDWIYYRQAGEAYYELARCYAEAGNTDAAVIELERALDYNFEEKVNRYTVLSDMYSLGEKLYEQIGDAEKAQQCREQLAIYK